MDQQPRDSERRDGEDDNVADQRERNLDDREAALDARKVRIEAQEDVHADRREEAQNILAGADERDDQADARDSVATKRDTAASLHSFLHDDEYDSAHKARRSSAMDRSDSKSDRTASAMDRSKLTSDDPTRSDAEDG